MDITTVKRYLVAYRIMAWVVGILLVVLVCIGMPLKYLGDNDILVATVGVGHGWLYPVLLLAAFLLKLHVNWSWKWFVGIALAGTIPFLSFFAEHYVTKDVRAQIGHATADLDTTQS